MTSSGGMVVCRPPPVLQHQAIMYAVLLSAIVVQLLRIDEAKSIVRNKGGEGKCLLAKANLHLPHV